MTTWPAAQFRGALLMAIDDVARLESNESDPATIAECSAVCSAIEKAVPFVTDAAPGTADGSTPLGSVLIISAPDCRSDLVVQQTIAALAAGNRVAVSHHSTLGRAARIALDSLERSAPPDQFRQFDGEPAELDWPRPSIVVMTATRVFLNDEPLASWTFAAEEADSMTDIIDFYREHRVSERPPVSSS